MKMRNRRDNCVGCILPSGNKDQFPTMIKHLKRLGIQFAVVKPGWFILAPEDVPKLPTWYRKPFIPVDPKGTHGHGIYEISSRTILGILSFDQS